MTIKNVTPSRMPGFWIFTTEHGDIAVKINIEDMPVWTFPEQFEHGLFWSGLNYKSVENIEDAYFMWADTLDKYTKEEVTDAWLDFCRDGVD